MSNVILADEDDNGDAKSGWAWHMVDPLRTTLYAIFPFFLVSVLWAVAHYHKFSSPPSYFPAIEGSELAFLEQYQPAVDDDGVDQTTGTDPAPTWMSSQATAEGSDLNEK